MRSSVTAWFLPRETTVQQSRATTQSMSRVDAAGVDNLFQSDKFTSQTCWQYIRTVGQHCNLRFKYGFCIDVSLKPIG